VFGQFERQAGVARESHDRNGGFQDKSIA